MMIEAATAAAAVPRRSPRISRGKATTPPPPSLLFPLLLLSLAFEATSTMLPSSPPSSVRSAFSVSRTPTPGVGGCQRRRWGGGAGAGAGAGFDGGIGTVRRRSTPPLLFAGRTGTRWTTASGSNDLCARCGFAGAGLSSGCGARTRSAMSHRCEGSLALCMASVASDSATSTMEDDSEDEEGGCTVGDTRGATMLLSDVSISRGSNTILEGVNLRVERDERWGIVGANGVGKSSLLGAIMGSVRMDEGSALIAPKVRVGYLKQTAVAGSTRTVAEEAASGMREVADARRAMEAAERAIGEDGDTSDAALRRLDRATEAFQAAGGWTQEQVVDSVLAGLGFTPEDSGRPCSDFSGGWQMRIALARLLLSKPSLLLLDEPSNHLDTSARRWLADYLANYDGSIILVSHDLELLGKSVNNIAEVAGGTLLTYASCTYSRYLEEKEFRAKTAAAEYGRNVAEAARLQAFVDRFGASATKASSAQSRVKMLEKMKREGKVNPPPVAVVEKRRKPRLVLPDPPKAIGETLVALQGADIGYDKSNAPLLKNIDLEIKRGMKVLLRGPNGAGKSTLMASLRGNLPLLSGERTENVKLRLGVFTQDLAQELDTGSRAVDLVTAHAREGKHGDITVSDQDARSVMGLLGLGADKPLRRVGDLSGGEKARVALSMFTLKASNLLMLDEPSNHLDSSCIDALSDALSNWGGKNGAIVVISHDRAFCESVGFTHIGTVMNGGIALEERGMRESDWDRYGMKAAGTDYDVDSGNGASAANGQLSAEEVAEHAKRRKLAFNAPKRIAKIEKLIEEKELSIAQLDEEMLSHGSDVSKLMELSENREKQELEVSQLMEEWEELEHVVAEFS